MRRITIHNNRDCTKRRYVIIIVISSLYVFLACLLLIDALKEPWKPNNAELVGKWELCEKQLHRFAVSPTIILNEDGTCNVSHVPHTVKHNGQKYVVLGCATYVGSDMEKITELDEWNFAGYWCVQTEVFYQKRFISFGDKVPYYSHNVILSPSHILIESISQGIPTRDITEDPLLKFILTLHINTQTYFSPSRVQYLYGGRSPDSYPFEFQKID